MTEHTPEPWEVDRDYCMTMDGLNPIPIYSGWVSQSWLGRDSTAESRANARRIVACVNACAGIPIEFLESVKLQDLLDEDWLEEVISDSLEMDWRPRDAARAILSRLERQHAEALTKE